MADRADEGTSWGLYLLAAIVGFVVLFACMVWQQGAEETPTEAADRASRQLDETINALNSGRQPQEISPPPSPPWPARHPILTAIGSVVAVVVLGRIYLYFERLEQHLAARER